MLSHANLAYQVQNFGFYLQLAPSERLLSLLPPWHIYERAVTYHVFSKATTTVSAIACHSMQYSLRVCF